MLHLLRDRNVLLLTLSYLTMNYVFYLISNWAFLYLIQERHFSVLESGWLAAIPPLGAAFGAGVGGVLTGIACRRLGSVKGFRRVPLLALPAAGLLCCSSSAPPTPTWQWRDSPSVLVWSNSRRVLFGAPP